MALFNFNKAPVSHAESASLDDVETKPRSGVEALSLVAEKFSVLNGGITDVSARFNVKRNTGFVPLLFGEKGKSSGVVRAGLMGNLGVFALIIGIPVGALAAVFAFAHIVPGLAIPIALGAAILTFIGALAVGVDGGR